MLEKKTARGKTKDKVKFIKEISRIKLIQTYNKQSKSLGFIFKRIDSRMNKMLLHILLKTGILKLKCNPVHF